MSRSTRSWAAALLSLGALLLAPAVASAIPPLHGVQLHTLWWRYPDADVARDLDLARSANANVVRIDVAWSTLESSEKGTMTSWYLDKLDAIVVGANARGMQVIATLYGSPCWASTAPARLKQGCEGAWWDRGVAAYPPADDAEYARVARWMTRRYGTRLAGLEVWNEPNLRNGLYWKTPDQARRYAQLVRNTYAAAKEGDRRVPVIVGSLAQADRPFLESLYAHGIKGYYDAISVHPFSAHLGPRDTTEPRYRQYTFLDGLRWVREGMIAKGDRGPVWITEFGWTTADGTPWQVSENAKARYIADSFEALDDLPWVNAATFYNLRDTGVSRSDFEAGFGVVRHDFSPKTSYQALRTVLGGRHWGTALPQRYVDAGPVTLRLERRRNVIYARGRGPALRLVFLRLTGPCRVPFRSRVKIVRVGTSGRFLRRIGTPAQIGGCRLAARVPASGDLIP